MERTTLTTTGINVTPAYDGDGTKIAFTSYRDGNAEVYLMDANGANQTNLTNHPSTDAGPTFTPEGRILFGSNRPSLIDEGFVDAYRMDASGANLTRLTTNAMITSTPVTGTTSTNSAEVTYRYDALGRLRKMTSSQGALVDEMDFGYSSPSDSHSYISRQGEIVFRAFSGAEGLYSTANKSGSGWSLQQYLFDARGDTRAVATADGTVPLRSQPDEYGRANSSPNVRVPYEFMGKFQRFFNPLTGLVHMGARMYQPKTGRFLSRDPITGGSANDYEYTSGDPINRSDLTGMFNFGDALAPVLGDAIRVMLCMMAGYPESWCRGPAGGRGEPGRGARGKQWWDTKCPTCPSYLKPSTWELTEVFGGLDRRELGRSSQLYRDYMRTAPPGGPTYSPAYGSLQTGEGIGCTLIGGVAIAAAGLLLSKGAAFFLGAYSQVLCNLPQPPALRR